MLGDEYIISVMIVCIIIYCSCTLLNVLCSKLFARYSIFIILFASIIEVIVCVLQILHFVPSNSAYYNITGTFENPGPLGGFLSICECVLFSYWINLKDSYNKKILFYYLTILAIFILSSGSRAAFLSLVIPCVIVVIRESKYRLRLKEHWKYVVLSFITLCVLLYFNKRESADGRFLIDKVGLQIVVDNSWKSNSSFAGTYGIYQARYFENLIGPIGADNFIENLNTRECFVADCPNIAFNEYLHIWIEHGLIALLLFLLIIILSIIISIKHNTVWGYGIISFSIFAFFSYPIHIIEFQIILSFIAYKCFFTTKTRINPHHIYEFIPIPLLLTAMFKYYLPIIESQNSLNDSLQSGNYWYTMGEYAYVVDDYGPVFTSEVKDYYSYFIYGHSLNKIGQYEKSDSLLSLGSKISSDPMFWNIMGNNSLALGRYSEAEERYKHAFYMVPNRLYPLTLLAKLYDVEGDTVQFLRMAEIVDKFVPKVESVNTERLRQEIQNIKIGYVNALSTDE